MDFEVPHMAPSRVALLVCLKCCGCGLSAALQATFQQIKQESKSPCFLPELLRAGNAHNFKTSPLFQLLCPDLLGESSF